MKILYTCNFIIQISFADHFFFKLNLSFCKLNSFCEYVKKKDNTMSFY